MYPREAFYSIISDWMELEQLKPLVQVFFQKMDIVIDDFELSHPESDVYHVIIKTPDSSLLIGYSGRNLEDIRTVLKNMLGKALDKSVILHIEVNDYLAQKDDKLYGYVSKKIKQLLETGKEVIFPYFNAYERKKIHNYVQTLGQNRVFTKSIGEGKDRRLHICKKSQTMTIDMDGVDI